MATELTQLSTDSAIVDEGRIQTAQTRLFFVNLLQVIDEQSTLTGSGSPEGVVEAIITKRYMDTAGVAGAILYIKRDADIAGDKTQGWVLV
ncbi:MAG: hypothetical protein ABUK13_04555 [Gammaproteobacteria bacterium]